MKNISLPFFVAITTLLNISFAVQTFADEPGEAQRAKDSYREAAPEAEQGSAASFDKRLPPVIPGEEIQDGRKKIKVWSTSGSVSTGEAPPAPNAPTLPNRQDNKVGNIGVVVDGRSYVPQQPATGSHR